MRLPESRQACAELGAAVSALREFAKIDQNGDRCVVVLGAFGGDQHFDLLPQFGLAAAQLLQACFAKRRLFALTPCGFCGGFVRLSLSALLRDLICNVQQFRHGTCGLSGSVHRTL